ncbi:MAG: OmpP1/FadL family transporter [Ignavibacteriaceae bacterium]
MKIIIRILIFIVLTMIPAKIIFAGGNDYLPLFGSRSLALNGLYFAGSDGLNCTLSNPAGLGYLNGKEFELTVIDRLGQQQFNSPDLGLYNSLRDDNLSVGGGFYWNFSSFLTAAVSYSRIIDYSVNWPFAMLGSDKATILTFDMYNKIHIDAIAPSIAFKFENLSIGATFNIYRIEQLAAFPQANNLASSGKGEYAYQFNLDQSAWTFGFNIGAIMDVTQSLRVGAVIKSGYKASLSGSALSQMFKDIDSTSTQTNISSSFQMPWIIGLGAICQPAKDLKLNFDVSYNLWSKIQNSIPLHYQDISWQNGLSHIDSLSGIRGNEFSLTYKNTFDIGVGLEFYDQNGMFLRLGYRFSQIPNSNSTFSFLFPGVDEHTLSAGIGFKGDDLSLDAGLSYSFGVSTQVNNSIYPQFSGAYNSNSYIPSITIHYAF